MFWLDDGGQFVSKAFHHFLKDHGIEKQTSIPYTPQQYGITKHANCTTVEIARSMFHTQNLDKSFWAEAAVNAVYIQNRCPTRAFDFITSDEMWSGSNP